MDEEGARAAWKEAASFRDLCELMARFIEGEIPFSPVHRGPVDPETEPLVAILADFNRAGFLTTCSQPGHLESGCEQRAFVAGFAFHTLARQLSPLRLHPELHVVIEPPGTRVAKDIPVTMDWEEPFTWSGFTWFEDLDHFKNFCSPTAMREFVTAWSISIIDLQWGRGGHLWKLVSNVLHNP